MPAPEIHIGAEPLDLVAVSTVLAAPVRLTLAKSAEATVARGADAITALIARGEAIYGVNTGFGKLASQRIGDADLERLQVNLVRSHSAGTGQPLPQPVVRLLMTLKAASLSAGHSGIRPATLSLLMAMVSRDVLPVIPRQGSVGASGDLAPLAHMSLVLIGEGEALFAGERLPGAEALAKAGLEPVRLGPKEGLALLNGTQVSTALALSRPHRGAAQHRRSTGGGRPVDRRPERFRHAVRCAYACAQAASRPATGGGDPARSHGRQRHPRLACAWR